MPGTKIAIIGAGAVGSTIAYTASLKNLAAKIILIDRDEAKEEGHIMDIADGLCFVETGHVEAANLKDARDADVIVITAGAPQTKGETRLDLVEKNKKILKEIFKGIGKIKKETIVILVSNPVDILTGLAQKFSRLPKNQVFGTGTALDTARLKTNLGHHFGVNPHSVHGLVLGEHGDSEFVVWSALTIGGVPFHQLPKTNNGLAQKIAQDVRREAYEIINRKGATYYGIAQTVSDIIKAIFYNQHRIIPVSTNLSNWNGVSGVCLGVPAVIGRNGVEKIWPLELDPEEKSKLKQSAETIKKYL